MVIHSEIVEVSAQEDGRCYIREHHTLEDGTIEEIIYLDGENPTDEFLNAVLLEHAENINNRE